MFFIRHKYGVFLVLAIMAGNASFAQYTGTATDSSGNKNILAYYHTFAAPEAAKPYTKLSYTRPNNQLMSWANDYPLTVDQVKRRFEQHERDNKVQNIIAKDIIKSLFSKKKKVAVIPAY